MPRVLLAAAAALVLSTAAFAAQLDPSRLVLRPSDVPPGYVVERDETGVRTNAERIRDTPELAPLWRRAGRVTGYEATFTRFDRRLLRPYVIESHVDVLRTSGGARMALASFDEEARRELRELRPERLRVSLGDGGWAYSATTSRRPRALYSFVAWRHERVLAVVFGLNLPLGQVRSLARTQEARIAAALR